MPGCFSASRRAWLARCAREIALRWLALTWPPCSLCGTAAAQDFRSGLSAYNTGDYARAFHDWSALAEQGDPAAEAGIGFLFHKGLGVAQDDAEAAKWFVKAAEQGQAEAQLLLGTLFFFGQGRAAKLRHRFRLVRHR